jgi:hypothetical protein
VKTTFNAWLVGSAPFAIAAMMVIGAPAAQAQIPYQTPGVENPVTYTFIATTTGDLVAYDYALSGAAFDEQLGLLVNGVDSGIIGLDDHSSSEGEALNFGTVQAGSVLTFYINVDDFFAGAEETYYSNPLLNGDGVNHVYSALFGGGVPNEGGSVPIPAGTYVGFEDESPLYDGGSDFNYKDEQFVFTDVTTMSSVPEPASWVALAGGMVGLGMVATRRRPRAAA